MIIQTTRSVLQYSKVVYSLLMQLIEIADELKRDKPLKKWMK